MEDGLAVRSSGLIERLERKSEVISFSEMWGKDNPFYWYLHLKELGKRAQTKEMVDEAVNGFSVNNPAYTILRVIAKKYLTREVCEIAVSKNGRIWSMYLSDIGMPICVWRLCKAMVVL